MASQKKRQSAEWQRRSLASKKGWKTRRKRERKEGLQKKLAGVKRKAKNAWRGVPKKKQKQVRKKITKKSKTLISRLATIKKKKRDKHSKVIRELEAEIRQKNLEIEILKFTADWPNAMPADWLREDQTIALHPSGLRHMGELTVQAREYMARAEEEGKLDDAVMRLSLLHNMPLREIYTLHFSP